MQFYRPDVHDPAMPPPTARERAGLAKPKPPAACASCRVLPAVDSSVMCQGCRNQARRLVAAFMGRRGEVLVRGPAGSGST